MRFAARWGYGATAASAGAHAGDGATLRGALRLNVLPSSICITIGVSLDSLRARRCRNRADGDHSGA